MKIRVKTSYTQLNISEAKAHNWNPQILNHKEMASLVYKLFGNTAKTETQVQIFNAINRFNFGWKIDIREVEEESYANLCKLVTDHYGSQYKFTFCRMLCNLKRFPGDRSKSHENGKKGKGRVVFFYARPKKQKT